MTLISKAEDVYYLDFKSTDDLAYITQTTLSVDDTRDIINKLKMRFPNIIGPGIKDICYATQNRQYATKKLAEIVDLVLVIGADNSSNSNRLRDIGLEMKKDSYLINGYKDINLEWFKNITKVGITAGASAPEHLVTEVVNFLEDNFKIEVQQLKVIEENIKFNLPLELR